MLFALSRADRCDYPPSRPRNFLTRGRIHPKSCTVRLDAEIQYIDGIARAFVLLKGAACRSTLMKTDLICMYLQRTHDDGRHIG